MGYLYDFLSADEGYKPDRRDGATLLVSELIKHIGEIKDEKLLEEVFDEVDIWLKIGAPSYFIIALLIVEEYKLHQFKDYILERRETILRGRDPDMSTLPYNITIWIDNTLKALAE